MNYVVLTPNYKSDYIMVHLFSKDISSFNIPEKFTFPFHYTPHPISVIAAEEVQCYLEKQTLWKKELEQGKMFGVLVIQTSDNQLGYLAAFSGNLDGKNTLSFFVPPIYDLLQSDGFFKKEEKNISTINEHIQYIQNSNEFISSITALEKTQKEALESLASMKETFKKAKKDRDERRASTINEDEHLQMIKESQFQKAEYKRQEKIWDERISCLKSIVNKYLTDIDSLKKERKERSASLQKQIFDNFIINNALGHSKNLNEIFESTAQKTPPAGAGECAAPKLLQYAYTHNLKPISMAEFWWGNSPKTEIRHHGLFYPACKNKCEPILNYMLQGLNVEPNPLSIDNTTDDCLEIIYEDTWILVINKPDGILSVPGKLNVTSIYDIVKRKYPEASGPLIVHRLDMATSGLLLIAKNKEIHQILQSQFEKHTIKKRYLALLDGIIPQQYGSIELPLCLDPNNRPRQIINREYGKYAKTEYKVIKYIDNYTLVHFFPITGRTHQLRVHASHPLGLNTPIVGDELYGKKSKRLFLHAEYLEFIHPVSNKIVHFEKKIDFESLIKQNK